MKDEYYDNMRAKKIARQLHDERTRQSSKKRLMAIIKTKFQTTMIGALQSFEDNFGYMWGHDKHPSEITPQEEAMREAWDKTRTDILNKGNSQLRAALDEIAQYTMTWEKYKTEFIVKRDQS